ncbi:flagellar biosynthesis protein FlhA [Novosphingobium beihaiensis]|uniref:Flagellar biosynthesis protein FlhA n=1 Tax=Novosphingobium beihaiensis TaxID=2930389 RepID=A0ABT0BQ66_9SPHN|nr:flagellar biosynthesis protein FlhA [Novosphingobium beihaiensis]MCJ2186976.1 flagellar biosynthesis protein FlhA [Novosphingobium beihaiensis]
MLRSFYDGNKDLLLVLGIVAILIILFSPIPPSLLDLAIIVNFGFGLTIMLLTLYVNRPVEFSTFPSILLVATLYRLSLNIAATRLILTGANAGEVIGSIGAYAVQGNFVIGLVVFAILVVVQYVVVTSGAQRVSEVAARFTLDSMPGQQMSIDADLNMGLIDQAEAKERRALLEKEASFYGAMDGASKFVKGDAIAGIIILLIDIIAGLIVGVVQMNMSWSDALARFTLLTIGDGIATQLPALIISIATGIIVTRSSADRNLSTEIFHQLAMVPRVPPIVASILLALMFLPGMPKWPIAIIVVIAGIAFFKIRQTRAQAVANMDEAADEDVAPDQLVSSQPAPIEIAFGTELGQAMIPLKGQLLERIAIARQVHEETFGLALPSVRFVDGTRLGALQYQIRLYGVAHGEGVIHPDRVMAIRQRDNAPPLVGISAVDPAFGIDVIWIENEQEERARTQGYSIVDPISAVMAHFNEVMKLEAHTLLTRRETAELLETVRARQPGLIEELVPGILTISDIQRILQNLLQERISIANIELICESLVDIARNERDTVELTEQLRQRMRTAICNGLRGSHRELSVLSLDPRLENQIVSSSDVGAANNIFGVDPRIADQLLRKLTPLAEQMTRQGFAPVLLCTGSIRRQLLRLTQRSIPQLAVISVDEIPMRTHLSSFEVIKFDESPVR